MTPREVIARAIFHGDHGYYGEFAQWEEESPDLRAAYFKMADAVIDALERMEVTEDMRLMYHSCATPPHDPIGEVAVIWRAMVRAMRDE